MKATALLLISVLCLFPAAAAQSQSQHPAPPASKSQKTSSAPAKPAPTTCRAPSATPEQVEALQSDLKKMRALLAQMQTNLAFVQNAPTPLKHQFELEIDMWRALLDHMGHQLEPLPPPGEPHP